MPSPSRRLDWAPRGTHSPVFKEEMGADPGHMAPTLGCSSLSGLVPCNERAGGTRGNARGPRVVQELRVEGLHKAFGGGRPLKAPPKHLLFRGAHRRPFGRRAHISQTPHRTTTLHMPRPEEGGGGQSKYRLLSRGHNSPVPFPMGHPLSLVSVAKFKVSGGCRRVPLAAGQCWCFPPV